MMTAGCLVTSTGYNRHVTHDAIVFKLLNKGWQVDLGAAFNQNTDAFNYNGTYYTPANVLPYVKDSKGNLAITPANFIPLQ